MDKCRHIYLCISICACLLRTVVGVGHVGLHVHIRQYRTVRVCIDIDTSRRIYLSCVLVSLRLMIIWDLPEPAAHCCATAACTVMYGRHISSTKVRALPESLGKCKLLKDLCVRAPPPPARVGVAVLRCYVCNARAGAGAGSRHGWYMVALSVAACRAARTSAAGRRWGRPGALSDGPKAATVGAQGRVEHRARGAAGGGRLARPGETVSAPPPRTAANAAAGAVRDATAQERDRCMCITEYTLCVCRACVYNPFGCVRVRVRVGFN
jgi:hypothetical protein